MQHRTHHNEEFKAKVAVKHESEFAELHRVNGKLETVERFYCPICPD